MTPGGLAVERSETFEHRQVRDYLEAAFRYSRIDLTDGAINGGEMDVYSLGLNWSPTQSVQFGADYRVVVLDQSDVRGVSSGFNVRLMLMLM